MGQFQPKVIDINRTTNWLLKCKILVRKQLRSNNTKKVSQSILHWSQSPVISRVQKLRKTMASQAKPFIFLSNTNKIMMSSMFSLLFLFWQRLTVSKNMKNNVEWDLTSFFLVFWKKYRWDSSKQYNLSLIFDKDIYSFWNDADFHSFVTRNDWQYAS